VLADEQSDGWAKAWALSVLGRAHYAVGDLVPARELAERSLALAEAGGHSWVSGWAYGLICRLETLAGNFPAARAAIAHSLRIREAIGDDEGRAISYGVLGYVALDEGNWAEARALALDTLRLLIPWRHPWVVAFTLELLATAEGGLGRAERFVRLVAAAERRREAIHPYVITDLRAVRERVMESTRRAMGPAAYEAAWAAGLAMTPDQAIEYALLDPDRPSGVPSGEALSAREREVAELVATGQTNRQIAEALVISERTADRHLANICAKLGFKTRTQLAAWVAAKN
jgi:DNA-binding CsgD family transcriptional regulator/tetratricopeptide (TPR) repeat protein